MQTQPIHKQSYTYKVAKDGAALAADVYSVAGSAPRPVLLWIHGGALIMGTRSNIHAYQLKKYVDAGYTVVSIDYRLAPETKLEAILEDVRDAYSWVLQKGPTLFQLEPNRVSVIGHSAGGYLALMTGFCVTPRPKAVVSFYGYGDIIGEWYTRPDPFYCRLPLVTPVTVYHAVGKRPVTEGAPKRRLFYLYCRQNGRWPLEVAGHDPDQKPDWFAPFCPLRNVTPDYPPTLLIHGDQDTDVPYAQSERMAAELSRHQVTHRMVTMPNYGHGFDGSTDAQSDAGVMRLMDEVVGFLAQHNPPTLPTASRKFPKPPPHTNGMPENR